MVVNMNSPLVLKKCGHKTMEELATVLGQKGPLLFLHPEPLRHAPKELRRVLERCLGLHVLGANEMTRPDSAHDKHMAETAAVRRTDRPDGGRTKSKRNWRQETVQETVMDLDAEEIAVEDAATVS
jgi:hypothetical protein